MRSFTKNAFAGKAILDDADKDQSDLLNEFLGTKPKVID